MSNHNHKILWLKVWGIAAIQGAITLTWVIYNLYFPLLLVELGASKELAITLLIIENALESIIEPVFGGLADRYQKLVGSKIPLISIGIILSSACFLLIPSCVFFSNGAPIWQRLILTFAIIWAATMAIFRSPAMALLGRCANTNNLPQAASILTLVGGIVSALRFDSYGLILKLGTGFAFALGSFSLIIAGAILRHVHPPELPQADVHKSTKVNYYLMVLLFLTGISISWGLRFLMSAVSNFLSLEFGNEYGKLAMMLFVIILSIAALPAGKIATKLGNYTAMQIGIVGTIITLPLMIFVPSLVMKIGAIACLIAVFSLVLNGVIPFTLSKVPASLSGLAVGMYFGGFGAGMSCFDLIISRLGKINIAVEILSSILSLILVLFWLFLSKQSQLR